MIDSLYWDASYAIAKTLQSRYPDVELADVSLGMVYQWTIDLPEFADDPELANEEILLAIFQDWFEENLEQA